MSLIAWGWGFSWVGDSRHLAVTLGQGENELQESGSADLPTAAGTATIVPEHGSECGDVLFGQRNQD